VTYAEGPERWAGSTYDPVSHYRASRVFDFFETELLTPDRLREINRRQIALLVERFDALGLDPGVIGRDRSQPLERLGGFLALKSPRAGALCMQLREHGVLADFRGEVLRLGPAPYLRDDQIVRAVEELGKVAGK
jgi:kynureninase